MVLVENSGFSFALACDAAGYRLIITEVMTDVCHGRAKHLRSPDDRSKRTISAGRDHGRR